MEIIFLGTGPAERIPRLGHNDPTCLDAHQTGSRSRRRRSSALIVQGNTRLLFDCGPDIIEQAAIAKLNKAPDAIFLTHGHSDAVGGIADVHKIWNQPVKIFADAKTIKHTQNRFLINPRENILWTRLIPGKPVVIKGLKITPLRVDHAFDERITTLGFKIQERLAYISDTRALPITASRALEGVTTLVIDGTQISQLIPTHLTAEAAIKIGKELGVGQIILTQIGHEYPPYKIAAKKISALAKKLAAPKTILAYDGLTVRL
ncbi:MAG: hypothetical protein HW383_830 [Candidatus Magasanikbacteria bacterium]|nr:hypothetical protein [Candidatus Magasanikbacteria bacterium]